MQELAYAAAYARDTRQARFHSLCAVQYFPVYSDVITAILQVWRHIQNPTQ